MYGKVLFTYALLASSIAAGQLVEWKPLADEYQSGTLPLVKQYCWECHSTEVEEGGLDLEQFAALSEVRKHPELWQKVAEALASGDMPPKESPQPTVQERQQIEQWAAEYLRQEARENAGDPGPVVLRRLSNAEYTYTLRDLTGVDSLEPAREFPVDGAAGEGFTNAGSALVMSPSLITKYLDAAKKVADHAVLLPDGIHFSPATTRRDWTNEKVAEIRAFYSKFTDAAGGTEVKLQSVTINTNQGGRIPLEKYLAATLAERESLTSGSKTTAGVAQEYQINAKYLGILWDALNSTAPSQLLDGVRARWRAAKVADAPALASEIAAWQKKLWTLGTVGWIGSIGGPKRWMQPANPLIASQELRLKIPATGGKPTTISLVASDAGDGNVNDYVVWRRPRLVAPKRRDVLLRDVHDLSRDLAKSRQQVFIHTEECLQAADELVAARGTVTANELALKYKIDVELLRDWFSYLGVSTEGDVKIDDYLTGKLTAVAGREFVNGWGVKENPSILANASEYTVLLPGQINPHSVVVHPSPDRRIAVGWRSPLATRVTVEARLKHVHTSCGNGFAWWLELRRGSTRQHLARGTVNVGAEATAGPIEPIEIKQGDVISLLIGPHEGNQACDLAAIELRIRDTDGDRSWSLQEDVSGDILAGNPHADGQGNQQVWHFFTELDKGGTDTGPFIPAGSLLAQWKASKDANEKQLLAVQLETFLLSEPATDQATPDATLYRELIAVDGPLFSDAIKAFDAKADLAARKGDSAASDAAGEKGEWGLDPALFGKLSNGESLASTDLCVQAPEVVQFRLPANIADGCELVMDAVLDARLGAEGSAQVSVVLDSVDGPQSSNPTATEPAAPRIDGTRALSYAAPVLVNAQSAARKRLETAFEDFRQLFPEALCYYEIVPVDEVITLLLFYREDDQLSRLMLDEAQQAELDRMWDELHYISQDALTLVDVLEQLIEYATQDADPKIFEPLRQPYSERAAAFRQRLADTEPRHLEALLQFASRAYRRPLSQEEADELRELHVKLRDESMSHEEAFQLTLARVLVSPAFLYRIEKPAAGSAPVPISDWELASRLSYFLWSAPPDEELRQIAASGRLSDTKTLATQACRMLSDAKTRRLATEFGCQWLQIYDFDQLDEKSERHFPTFVGLRGAMYEESIRFVTDLFQNDGSVLDILDADYTFLNEDLAQHYEIADVHGAEWRRIDGMQDRGRGGILGLAATLAKQSGASRTSPVLRGVWVSEALLGEKLPKPPKNVPPLPDDDGGAEGLSVRQMVEKHRAATECAKCHDRIDPLGFAFERFDAIGRLRTKDAGGLPIETKAELRDGTTFDGLPGLRQYLLTQRKDQFVRQFCRKLLGYALGRGVQLSDEPLLDEMVVQLGKHDYRLSTAVEVIVQSKQFRFHRGGVER